MARTQNATVSLSAASAFDTLRGGAMPLAAFAQGELDIEIRVEQDMFWIVIRRGEDGGMALRMPAMNGESTCAQVDREGALARIECTGKLGTALLTVSGDPNGLEQIRATLEFTATRQVEFEWLPRDLVVFSEDESVAGPEGKIEAVQRKLNTALAYFSLKRPALGKILYLQNLTALNDYFNATGSKPESAVGGELPEIGYRPPVNPETGKAALPAGKTLTLYDTLLVIRSYARDSEEDSAWQFLDMLGAAYPLLSPPTTEYRDWVWRADQTIHDLMHAPEASIEHYGLTYFHPYTASEYPDAMVQLSLASAIDDWGRWRGVEHPLKREIIAGLEKFYDDDRKTLRRYLPNVGPDKDRDAVDSWYLYHPLLNLANLALAGEESARDLFLRSIDYGIRSAHHFRFKWPILYNVRDFSVIRDVAEADQRGQTDVGGIYAWVMLQAFELTREHRFLTEAVRAIEAAKGMRFNLNYQANLTAWGAAACIRLWRITNEKHYLTQSYVYLASFFHNSQIWESSIGLASSWKNFLGVTCLQDAPYMAAYECFDSFAALERYLDYGGPDLIPAVQLLLGDYCRYALDRAWYYYPDALPAEAIAEKNRNGYINPSLSFPLEDLYPDGQQAGQVGQEVYGGGAAMIFATRAFHHIHGAPFLLHCDTFIRAKHLLNPHTLSLKLDGHETTRARIALIPNVPEGRKLIAKIWTLANDPIEIAECEGRLEGWVPANAGLMLGWQETAG